MDRCVTSSERRRKGGPKECIAKVPSEKKKEKRLSRITVLEDPHRRKKALPIVTCPSVNEKRKISKSRFCSGEGQKEQQEKDRILGGGELELQKGK